MKMLKFLLLMLTYIFISNIALANDSDNASAEDYKVYQVDDNVSLVSSIKFLYAKPRVVIKVVYPQLSSDITNENVDHFNTLVDDIIKEEVTAYKKEVANNQTIQASLPKSANKNLLNIDFAAAVLNTNREPIVSIRFNIEGYVAGMAHPFHKHRVLNYDLENGEQLELDSLFTPEANYLQFLSDYSRQELDKQLQNKEMIMRGTEPSVENFQIWNLNPGGLLISFEETQVAPYVFGTQKVLIPYSVLKNIISPDSPIATCLKHSRFCLGHNLLTGGFIDQAINAKRGRLNPLLSKL